MYMSYLYVAMIVSTSFIDRNVLFKQHTVNITAGTKPQTAGGFFLTSG